MADRLNTKDPRLKRRCHTCVRRECNKHEVFSLVLDLRILQTTCPSGDFHLLPSLMAAHDTIQTLTRRLREEVASTLRPLLARGVPWSPHLQACRNTIDFWSCLVRHREGVATGQTHLCRSAKQLGLLPALQINLPDAQLALCAAEHAHHTKAKPKAQSWREFFLQDLLDALVVAWRPGHRTREQALASQRHKELALAKGASCKRVQGCSSQSAVLSANVQRLDGSLHALHTQPKMIRAMTTSNIWRQQQCQGAPSVCEPFLSNDKLVRP